MIHIVREVIDQDKIFHLMVLGDLTAQDNQEVLKKIHLSRCLWKIDKWKSLNMVMFLSKGKCLAAVHMKTKCNRYKEEEILRGLKDKGKDHFKSNKGWEMISFNLGQLSAKIVPL